LHFPPEFNLKSKACNVQLQAFFSLYGKDMENIQGPHWMMLVVGAHAIVRDSPSGPATHTVCS
jgi:hypothetical protein